MNRTNVLQNIIDAKNARSYLEIGVAAGENFFRINARQKVAVDPGFAFSKVERLKWSIKNFRNINATYYESTSDDFFKNQVLSSPFDVIFIDGLHTFDQSLRDTVNALEILSDSGIIVLHDCNPPHEAAAYPAASNSEAARAGIEGWTGEWCGDVWKTICYLRINRSDLRVFVLDCDYGLGIITKGEPDNLINLDEKELNHMNYADLISNKNKFLNLKDESYFPEFLRHI